MKGYQIQVYFVSVNSFQSLCVICSNVQHEKIYLLLIVSIQLAISYRPIMFGKQLNQNLTHNFFSLHNRVLGAVTHLYK